MRLNRQKIGKEYRRTIVCLALAAIAPGVALAMGHGNGGGNGGGGPGGGGESSLSKALVFLDAQAGASGLIDSFPGDGVSYSYTYDNALAALAYISQGASNSAESVLDAYLTVGPAATGGFYHRYDADTGQPAAGLLRVGHNAYLLQAMNLFYLHTGNAKFNAIAQGIANYMLSLQDANGGIFGYSGATWKSAENNLACYCAVHNLGVVQDLPAYTTSASLIENFISTELWDGARFLTGENDTMIVTDAQALGTLIMGQGYANGSYWIESQTLNTQRYKGNKTITGFDLNTDKDTAWIEGTLQQALAFMHAGDTTKRDHYKSQSEKLQQSSGAFLEASNLGTTGFGENFQPWEAIAPTAWYILVDLEDNVFELLP